MDRNDFDKLDIAGQINYISGELIKGLTLTKICKSINIGRATIRDWFVKGGYSFKQYFKSSN